MPTFGRDTIIETEAAEKFFARLSRAVHNLEPFFNGPLTNRVHKLIGEVFETRGANIRSPWPPLKPRTIEEKARIGRDRMGPLRRYNTLWASLVKRSAPQGVHHATKDSLTIGTTVPYASPHQHGSPKAHIPQRKIIPEAEDISDGELNRWDSLLIRYLEKKA